MSDSPPAPTGWFARACRHNAVGAGFGVFLLVVPFAVLILCGLPFAWIEYRPLGRRLLSEGNVVEWIGFFGFFLGGIASLRLSGRLRKLGEPAWLPRFYLVLGVVLLILAGEEISWGQKVFGYSAPAFFQSVNEQSETNIHNLPIIQELNEWFLITVGLLGFAASTFRFHAKHWRTAIPPLIGHWFLVLAVMEIFDITPLHHLLPDQLDYALAYLIEAGEMLLGIACFLWVTMNARILKGGVAERS